MYALDASDATEVDAGDADNDDDDGVLFILRKN